MDSDWISFSQCQLKKYYSWRRQVSAEVTNTGALIFNYRTQKSFWSILAKIFVFLLDLNTRRTVHWRSWNSQSTWSIRKVRHSFPVTWETCGQVLHQCFLGDRFSRRVHCWDGQAKDFPEWNKLRLTDRWHTDWWHITCRKTIFKWAVHWKTWPCVTHTHTHTALPWLSPSPCITNTINSRAWELFTQPQPVPTRRKGFHKTVDAAAVLAHQTCL